MNIRARLFGRGPQPRRGRSHRSAGREETCGRRRVCRASGDLRSAEWLGRRPATTKHSAAPAAFSTPHSLRHGLLRRVPDPGHAGQPAEHEHHDQVEAVVHGGVGRIEVEAGKGRQGPIIMIGGAMKNQLIGSAVISRLMRNHNTAHSSR